MATHVDGRNDSILELVAESGFDEGEAFTPPPITNLTIAQSRAAGGQNVFLE